MTDSQEGDDAPGPVEQAWDGEAPSHYVNVVRFAGGPFDLSLVFGKQDITRKGPAGHPPITEEVRVTMSWGHAKSMIPLLAQLVASYEKDQGPIPAPGFEQHWKA